MKPTHRQLRQLMREAAEKKSQRDMIKQIRRIIIETFHTGVRPMRDVLPPDVQHEMRVIQLMNVLFAMKKRGHTNAELIEAIDEVREKLTGGTTTQTSEV